MDVVDKDDLPLSKEHQVVFHDKAKPKNKRDGLADDLASKNYF